MNDSPRDPLLTVRRLQYRFVLEPALGPLARHLRMLGFDTLWERETETSLLIAATREDDRILLTSDPALFEQAAPGNRHLLRAAAPGPQLREALEAFGLSERVLAGRGYLTVCLDCNSPLLPARGQHLLDRIPASLRASHEEFLLCPRCERVYWRGSPLDAVREWILKTLR